MTLIKFNKLIASLSLFACTSLSAAPFTVDVAGIESHGEPNNPANTVLFLEVGANSRVVGVAYDVSITAADPSWLQEIGVIFETSKLTESASLLPGLGDNFSGTKSYSGSVDLIELGLSFNVGLDGILRLEFFDDPDDYEGADGRWNFGTITFDIEPTAVPEPATTALLGAGLAMLGYAGRRRRAAGKLSA